MDSPYTYDKQISGVRNLLKVIKSYFIHVYGDMDVLITTNNKTIETRTDKYGGFSIIVDFLHEGDLRIEIPDGKEPLKTLQSYPIIFPNTNGPFDIISDIDDTIIVSYTADLFKRVSALAFTSPHDRKVVGFTKNLYKEFEKLDARVFYISKSESNLFALLTSFIEHNNLLVGKLILTPYLKFGQLIHPKKGRNYKLNKIKFILENTSNKKYVLFGDDSQRDMEIYSSIAEEFPNRILKIYIRQTKRKILPYQKKMWERLKLVDAPVTYFDDKTNVDIQTEINQLKNAAL